MTIKAPYLPYDRLRDVAEKFLAEHHPTGQIPVPIEYIVEYDFHMDIISEPGLSDAFGVDSYLTHDMQEIRVDDFCYKKRPKRYRFSLAHELSHRLIHADIWPQLKITTIDEWKQAINTIPPQAYTFIELQAYNLAGLILVPPRQFKESFDRISRKSEEAGLPLDGGTEDLWGRALSWIGDEFQVSRGVIEKRGKYDDLWDEIR